MARRLNGSSQDLRFSAGNVAGVHEFGTVGVLIKRGTTGGVNWHCPIYSGTGSQSSWGLSLDIDTGNTAWAGLGTNQSFDSFSINNTTLWYLIIWVKPTGTVASRYHYRTFNGTAWSAWTHDPGDVVANSAAPIVSQVILGSFSSGDWFNGDIAAAFIADSWAPNDAAIEAIGWDVGIQNWKDGLTANAPTSSALWCPGADTSGTMVDLMGGGADQTNAFSGTQVAGPTGWSETLSGGATDDAPGETANVAISANNASTMVSNSATTATVSITANNAAASVQAKHQTTATVSIVANNAAIQTSQPAPATAASVTLQAFDATIQIAKVAEGSDTTVGFGAFLGSTSVVTNGSVAGVATQAENAQIQVGVSGSDASVSGTAYNATATVSFGTETGIVSVDAFDAVVSTSVAGDANGEDAVAQVEAFNAGVSASFSTETTTVSIEAHPATTQVNPVGSTASVGVSASDAGLTVDTNSSTADATILAEDGSILAQPSSILATVSITAFDATVTTQIEGSAQGQLATFTVEAFDAIVVVAVRSAKMESAPGLVQSVGSDEGVAWRLESS